LYYFAHYLFLLQLTSWSVYIIGGLTKENEAFMLKTNLVFGFFLSSVVMLTGCASLSPIAITLTDLGTASKTEHSMKGLHVMRSVNITGLGPNEVVGSISVDVDPPNWFVDWPSPFSSVDYPDSLGLRLSPECSHIVEMTFEGDKNGVKNVATLRDGVQELVELVSRKLDLEIKRTILSTSAEILADKTSEHNTEIEILKILQRRYPTDKLTNATEVNESLVLVTNNLEVIKQIIDKKRKELKAALQTPGIVVTRWSQERKKSGMLDFFKAVTFQASSSSQQEGFLILGEPRVTTLLLGYDSIAGIPQLLPDSSKTEEMRALLTVFNAKRTYVTYYQLSAKHIAWGENRSGMSNLAIQADISKIASTLQPYLKAGNLSSILNDLQAVVELEMSRAYDYGNSGLLSGGKTKVFPIRFTTEDYAKALVAEQRRAQDYRPIYNARGTLGALIAAKLGNAVLESVKHICARASHIDFGKDELDGKQNQHH
jgi:hypothetical protein